MISTLSSFLFCYILLYMKIRYFLLILLVFSLFGCQMINQDRVKIESRDSQEIVALTSTPELTEPDQTTATPKVEAEKPKPEEVKPAPPKFLDYPVAFGSQAPFANWDELHE